MKRLLAILLASAALGGGCSSMAPARCDAEGMDPQPHLTCDMAIAAARARLAGVAGVTEIEVRYGGFCPPAAFCGPFGSDLTDAWIIVRRADGTDLMLIVSLRPDGSVQATEPAPMPGPTMLPEG